MISSIDINEAFNGLPVRILGTHDRPIFYASEIERLLGTRLTNRGTAGFAPIEIVQADERERLGIKTLREYRSGVLRERQDMILLTEFGVYRVLMNSKSEIAEKFRLWIYDVLYKLRTAGFYKVEQELQRLRIDNDTQRERVATLVEQRKTFENRMERIYIVELPRDRTVTKPFSNIHPDHYASDPDSDDERRRANDLAGTEIQPYDNEERVARLQQLRADMLNDPESQNRSDNEQVWEHIRNNKYMNELSKYVYKISDTYTRDDMIYGTVKYYGFVKNAREAIEELDRQLGWESLLNGNKYHSRLKTKAGVYYYYNVTMDEIHGYIDMITRPAEPDE